MSYRTTESKLVEHHRFGEVNNNISLCTVTVYDTNVFQYKLTKRLILGKICLHLLWKEGMKFMKSFKGGAVHKI